MKTEQQENINELWAEYFETRSLDVKNQILTHYIDLVVAVVKRLMPYYREYSEQDDLVSAGVLGLIDAVSKYNESFGVKFQTYATFRIRGEVIDYLRKQDWAPTTLRKKIGTIQQAYETMENELGRLPTDREVADKLQISESEVRKVQGKAHMFNIVNFESMVYERYAEIPNYAEDDPQKKLEKEEMKANLKSIIETLPEKERMVIVLHYYEGLTMKNIAKILKISESRVSQIHSRVLTMLRTALGDSFGE